MPRNDHVLPRTSTSLDPKIQTAPTAPDFGSKFTPEPYSSPLSFGAPCRLRLHKDLGINLDGSLACIVQTELRV